VSLGEIGASGYLASQELYCGILGITTVLFVVLMYANTYMQYEEYNALFHCLLVGFALSMGGFVYSEHWLVQCFWWECLGAISYMLVHFWGVRPAAACASQKALYLNRFFDLIICVWLVLCYSASINPSARCVLTHLVTEHFAMLNLGIFAMVCVKCLALGIHHWLPDAMEGPTPVSACIHAATLVVAGSW
jgi:NADH-quinone oxidoreductase subunit L